MTQIGTNNGLSEPCGWRWLPFGLSSPDAAVRLDAVREMMQSLDEPTVALLRQRIGVETNSGVKKEIATGLALAALQAAPTRRRVSKRIAALSPKR